jgi:hypothetical protein
MRQTITPLQPERLGQSPVNSTANRGRPVDGGFEGGGVGDQAVGDGDQLKHSSIVVWPATKIYHVLAAVFYI